ncbi:MAG: metallophosphoesterase [Planctomycetota bacterium]|jgi:hypothetical protein
MNVQSAAAVVELFDHAATLLRSSPHRSGSAVCLPARGRLLATGDLHDNPDHFQKIVHLARLDEAEDHHLVLHEIIHSDRLVNGVDLSHRMLARAAELLIRYPRQVHVLLANHELAQLTGQGVSKGAGNSVDLFDDGLAFVFGDEGPEVAASIDRFIRAMPLAAKSEAGVLCAHSLPGPGAAGVFDSDVLERELTERDYLPRASGGSAALMVWGRGYTDEDIETLAGRWQVKLFCLGHVHVENGIAMRGPRVIVLNSDHEFAVALPIDLGRVPTAEEAMLSAVPLRGVGIVEEGTEGLRD